MSRICINLLEWQTIKPERGSELAGLGFGDRESVRQLAERLTRSGMMKVFELAQGLELQATSYVGRFNLGDLDVTVQPKLTGSQLLNLLRYAYGLRHLDLYEPVGYAAEKWGFQDLLIQQLAAEITEIIARGVHRDYVRTQVDLASPRGQIDFNRYVRDAHSAKAKLPCVHHPRIENNILNQAITGGLHYAVGLATNVDLRSHLNRLTKTLSQNVSFKRLDTRLLDVAWMAMDRRTTAYESALKILELLLHAEGISLHDDVEQIKLPGFLFDMNHFFQSLISRFLHDHLVDVVLHDEYRLKYLFSYALGQNPCNRKAPTPRPDFVIMCEHQMVAVLDAKYRDLWEMPLPREMLYQLSIYALGRTGRDRTATILYPTMNGHAKEQVLCVTDPLRGSTQAKVVLRPVKLMELESLVRLGQSGSKQRTELAHWLAFGASKTIGLA